MHTNPHPFKIHVSPLDITLHIAYVHGYLYRLVLEIQTVYFDEVSPYIFSL